MKAINDPLSPTLSLLAIQRKATQEVESFDNEILVRLVPFLGWPAYLTVTLGTRRLLAYRVRM